MNKDIKCEIIECAKQLFNQDGYNMVSMRQIADTLGISVGNLTYHYKKKEDLIEAIIVTQHKSYVKFTTPQTLEELNQLFIKIIAHQKNHAFYFHNYTQIGELSQKVREIQIKVTADLHESLTFAFRNLKDVAIMREDELAFQSESLMQVVMMICIGDLTSSLENRLTAIWLLIYPLLSEQGKLVYGEKIQSSI